MSLVLTVRREGFVDFGHGMDCAVTMLPVGGTGQSFGGSPSSSISVIGIGLLGALILFEAVLFLSWALG